MTILKSASGRMLTPSRHCQGAPDYSLRPAKERWIQLVFARYVKSDQEIAT
jgi:hypothetical protein